MQIREDSNEIMITHIPAFRWVVGVCSIIVLTTITFLGLRSLSWIDIAQLATVLPMLALILACGYFSFFDAGFNSGVLAPVSIVVLNRNEKYIQISEWRIYGKQVRRYYLYQVRKLKSYKGHRPFTSRYFLSITLNSGKNIKLWIPLATDKKDVSRFIKKLNSFLRVRETAELSV